MTVGDTQDWLPELIERAKELKVGNGFDPSTEIGPLITPAAKERVERLIASCEKEGGRIALDGRGVTVPGYPDGNFVGATILEADTAMECYQCVFLFRGIGGRGADARCGCREEIFGPVLVIVKADNLDHAIKIINSNRCTSSPFPCSSSRSPSSLQTETEPPSSLSLAQRHASLRRRSTQARSESTFPSPSRFPCT